MLKPFELKIRWPRATGQGNAVDASFADLWVTVNGEPVATYVDLDDGTECDHIEQPMIFVAEWLVENWWSLFWEPEKSEDVEEKKDHAFIARHSLLAAEHGFALPDIRFLPTGDDVHVFARPHVADHARARFTKSGNTAIDRAALECAFTTFIEAVCTRLTGGIGEDLKADWTMIRETTDEAAEFCRLKGALGLSPYISHPKIESALDKVSDHLSSKELLDLCQTATIEDFLRSANVAEQVSGILDTGSSEIDLTTLAALPVPSDVQAAPAFRRGVNAARTLRSELGIQEADIEGGKRIFDILQIDWKAESRIDLKGFASPISGAIQRFEKHGRLALVHQAPSSRHFAAARATYFFWAGHDERRLLTNALTRDQQASRAFAAELLIPQTHLRSCARKGRISWDQVNEIAERVMVASDVVRHQATNTGLRVVQ